MNASLSVLGTLAGMLVVGHVLRAALRRLRVPPAVTLMALGALAGPWALDLLPAAWVHVAPTLSRVAFVILLLRAGLGLAPENMRRMASSVLLLGAIPMAAEMLVLSAGARLWLFEEVELALLLGFLIAAVSPAVVLPIMLDLKDGGHGERHFIPDRIMGQTVVNAVLAQTGILCMLHLIAPEGDGRSALSLAGFFPLSLAGGILLGAVLAWILPRGILTGGEAAPGRPRGLLVFVVLALGTAAYFLGGRLGLESISAALAVGVVLRRRSSRVEPALRQPLKVVWMMAEIPLFVNIGASVDLSRLSDPGLLGVLALLLTTALVARVGVAWLATSRSGFERGERGYLTAAHVPKATIQAVFGALPLVTFQRVRTELIPEGQTLLVMAVVAIVATAPLGAFLLDRLGVRWLAPPRIRK